MRALPYILNKLYLPAEDQLRAEIEAQKEMFRLQHGDDVQSAPVDHAASHVRSAWEDTMAPVPDTERQ